MSSPLDAYYLREARQKGAGGPRVYRGSPFIRGGQSGDGFGNILSSLVRTVMPIAKSIGKTVAKQGAAHLGSYVSDLIDGASPKPAAKRRSSELFDAVKSEGKTRLSAAFNGSRPRASPKKPPLRRPANKRRRKRTLRSDLYGSYRQ